MSIDIIFDDSNIQTSTDLILNICLFMDSETR